ncbi:short-chain alcohol dehydrogenase [Frankia torreyi]|uniref:Short-chain alcohol dehydrogenase n=2 Tax=Frankia TaxID=1854 RepID=A0A0D8BF76_9ACTN|nr:MULTISPECIES: SDR family oxidoreductase [Frankia]KJE22786.1 short-chain alcohol dehydrogenase [Frankia torreyi]
MSAGTGRLAGRTAIVTGASRGLGRAIALAFAREGAAVAVVARTEAQWDARLPGTVHEVVEEIVQEGGRALAVPADLSRPADVERIVEVTRARLGPVDLLVNNAALTVPGRPPAQPEAKASPGKASPGAAAASGAPTTTDAPRDAAPAGPGGSPAPSGAPGRMPNWASFLNFPLKGLRMHFEIGLFASYRLMQLVLPDMIDLGRGSIVNISSVAGFIPGEGPYAAPGTPGPIAYGGNKAALHHLAQAVAIEAQAYGIAVNVLSPSEPVITPGNLVAAAGESDWASPEDFAEATVLVALADPATTNGQLLWSDDMLHPDLGRRGWLRPT